jgi:hypothetical protein
VIEGTMLQANRKVRNPQSNQLRSIASSMAWSQINVTTGRRPSKQLTKLKLQK